MMFSKRDNQPNQDDSAGVAYKPTVAAVPKPAPIPAAPPAAAAKPAERRMTVGPGIGLDGKITNCDILVVEGTVEATLECKNLEIARGGRFNGEASVESAVIDGDYDGRLTVSDLMRIHSTGRVSGTARYGRLEIEVGGELSGDVAPQAHADAAAANANANANANAPKPTLVAGPAAPAGAGDEAS